MFESASCASYGGTIRVDGPATISLLSSSISQSIVESSTAGIYRVNLDHEKSSSDGGGDKNTYDVTEPSVDKEVFRCCELLAHAKNDPHWGLWIYNSAETDTPVDQSFQLQIRTPIWFQEQEVDSRLLVDTGSNRSSWLPWGKSCLKAARLIATMMRNQIDSAARPVETARDEPPLCQFKGQQSINVVKRGWESRVWAGSDFVVNSKPYDIFWSH
ncbi:hypothetical protein DL93DRAFT_2159930 [Clavulina sp. PMI_390]|nr:hypothetical protein DL93DRAFT_2159930 [Clavulina sp. PMI_390]